MSSVGDTRDWMVVDRLHEKLPVKDLQYGEAVDLAREMSHEDTENFGQLLTSDLQVTDRYVATLDTEKIRARIIGGNLPVDDVIGVVTEQDGEKVVRMNPPSLKESEYQHMRDQSLSWRHFYMGDWCPPEV